jgi:hypothetical protein
MVFSNVFFAIYWLYQMGIEILKLTLQKDEDLFRKVTCRKINPDAFYDKHLREDFSRWQEYLIEQNLKEENEMHEQEKREKEDRELRER